MKEKINLLARGILEYENPEIIVSEDQIDIEVEAGNLFEGSFEIDSLNGLEIRAKTFSSNKLMKLRSNDYIKRRIRVFYTFDALALVAGEVITGHFSIISNGGEFEIPYKVTVCQPFCHTSIGPIKDLSQFANLAQVNWHEAVKIFRSPNFARVFLVNKKYAHIYEMLIHSRNINQALEEFLCTIRKKRSIEIRISQDTIEYEDLKSIVSERLVIEKNHWGYQRIFVSVVGDFIQIYKKELTTEDFLGSYYELEYIIDPSFFRYGNNYGKIIVKTINQTIEINVNCLKSYKNYREERRKSVRESVYELYDYYSKLQLGTMDKSTWIRKTREAVDCCRNRSREPIYILYETHFHLLCDRKDLASEILSEVSGREIRRKSVSQYCYFLYLSALCREDISYTHFVKDKIDSYYESSYATSEILWIKLKLSDNMTISRKYSMIKRQFEFGSRNRLLYWEAIKAINEEPSLLREFDEFEIQLINWAVKNDCIEMKTLYRFADIVTAGRRFSQLALKTLISLYDTYKSKEILSGICALLIRGNRIEPEVHQWYRQGILVALKNPGLYENYMRSLSKDNDDELPVGVLIYFNYDNQLPKDKKSFLYAYVVNHKEQHPKIYRDYENIIKAFTHEQLGKGYINEDMVTLYQHFIDKDHMSSKTVAQLPNVLFKKEIIVKNPWITHVIVSHRDVEQMMTYPFDDGRAFIDIYMEDYYLIFVDKMEYLYSGTIDYELRDLLDTSEFVRACAKQNIKHYMVLLNRTERAIKYQKSDDISIDIYKRTLKIPNVGKQLQKSILKNLIDFYYDNYEGETLEKYLLQLDISMLDNAERGNIIEYYIQRGLYDLAYAAIINYGYDNIQDKKMMRLCSRKIKERHFEDDVQLREMSYFVFTCGKYDDSILEYLIKYYLGTTKDLYEIWEAAKNFEVDTYELEGKLLCQMLFAEAFISNAFSVFESYYKQKPEPKIVRAFLAYYAYKYVVQDELVDRQLFTYLEMEEGQMNGAKDVCNLALLKNYALSNTQIRSNAAWIVPRVESFIERGMLMPFFKSFSVLEQLPGEILDKTYISYRTNPKNTVLICYKIVDGNGEQPEYSEEMHNVFGGIFVKTFTLFVDEQLKYYIKESGEGVQNVTDSAIIHGDCSRSVTGGRLAVNHMLALVSEGSMEQLKDVLQNYEEKRNLAKKLFTLI